VAPALPRQTNVIGTWLGCAIDTTAAPVPGGSGPPPPVVVADTVFDTGDTSPCASRARSANQ
jgi:hypothetical protein